MARRIRLATEASLEFREALLYYDAREIGLGDAFFLACDEAFRTIAEDPDRHPAVGRGFHRFVMPKYPFAIFYEFDDAELIVASVFNCSRDPQIWRKRLGLD